MTFFVSVSLEKSLREVKWFQLHGTLGARLQRPHVRVGGRYDCMSTCVYRNKASPTMSSYGDVSLSIDQRVVQSRAPRSRFRRE